MSFKVKSKIKKRSPYNKRVTLHAKYEEKSKYFDDLQLKAKLNENIKQDIINKINNFEKDNTKLENKELEEKLNLIDKLETIKSENENIYNNKESIDYLLDTGNLLFNYFTDKNIENSKNDTMVTNNSQKTVMDFFNGSKTKNTNSKANIYEEYSELTDKLYFKKIEKNNMDTCKYCGQEKILHMAHGKMICPTCGDESFVLIDSDKPSYKEPPREISYFAYKRINHFNEWLAQFQAKESTDIPKEVYDEILIELKKERLSNINNLNPLKIREILKKLKKNKYYEHVPHIINRLNGVPPPVMTRETEEELRRMFKEIQVPFHKFCPKNRKNFLSYSYVLHKFVQLLELDDFLPCFMLLKSREKLHQQDQIWKQICGYLKWQYIPSV